MNQRVLEPDFALNCKVRINYEEGNQRLRAFGCLFDSGCRRLYRNLISNGQNERVEPARSTDSEFLTAEMFANPFGEACDFDQNGTGKETAR